MYTHLHHAALLHKYGGQTAMLQAACSTLTGEEAASVLQVAMNGVVLACRGSGWANGY